MTDQPMPDQPMRGHLITCRACQHFLQGHGAPQALGRCQGVPWDGHQGQWPDKRHVCLGFTAATPQAPQPAPPRSALPESARRASGSVPPKARDGGLAPTSSKSTTPQPRPRPTEPAGLFD